MLVKQTHFNYFPCSNFICRLWVGDKGCWASDIANIKAFDQRSDFTVTGICDMTKLTGLPVLTVARQNKASKFYCHSEGKTRIDEKETFPADKHTIVSIVTSEKCCHEIMLNSQVLVNNRLVCKQKHLFSSAFYLRSTKHLSFRWGPFPVLNTGKGTQGEMRQ